MAGGFCSGAAWGVGANWTDGAAIPVSTSLAMMPASNNNNITDGGGDANGIDLALLKTCPNFTGLFGTSGAPIQTAAELVEVYGSGGFYFECDENGVGALDVGRAEIMCPNNSVPVELGSCDIAGGGTGGGEYDYILALRGVITLKANIKFEAAAILEVSSMGSTNDVNLTIASGADTLPTLHQHSGRVNSAGAITTGYIHHGATCIQDVAQMTTAHVFGTLNMKYGSGASPGPTAAVTIYVYPGGILNLHGSDEGDTSQYKTVTNVILFPGATLLRNSSIHIITNLYQR